MFKIVVIAGKYRGKEITLEEGETIVGRSDLCDFPLTLDGVSKQHFKLTVDNDNLFLEDLNSSNGTWVNNKLIRKMNLKAKDQIKIPNSIMQVVYIEERKVIVKKKVEKRKDESDDDIEIEEAPNDLVGKIVFLFKTKVMPLVYGINKNYEWKHLIGMFLFLYSLIVITTTVAPIILTTNKTVLGEIEERTKLIAQVVLDINQVRINEGDNGNLSAMRVSFIKNQTGINYEIFDFKQIVYHPTRVDSDGINRIQEPFSSMAHDFFTQDKNKNKEEFINVYRDGSFGYARKIIQHHTQNPIGIIALKYSPKSLAVQNTRELETIIKSFAYSLIWGIVFFGFIYFLTNEHMDEVKKQIDLSLRGQRKNLESNLLMEEIKPIREKINTLLQRIRDYQSDGADNESDEIEDPASYIITLQELLIGAQGPVMILDSDKNIKNINIEAEDLTGIRESTSSDTSILDSSRDQGLAATIIDLCDQSANNSGTTQDDDYEIGGNPYRIYVTGLIGKDSFAKCFYITFNKDE